MSCVENKRLISNLFVSVTTTVLTRQVLDTPTNNVHADLIRDTLYNK
jgi:hypothetical protein